MLPPRTGKAVGEYPKGEYPQLGNNLLKIILIKCFHQELCLHWSEKLETI
jgi:hypothetical protein